MPTDLAPPTPTAESRPKPTSGLTRLATFLTRRIGAKIIGPYLVLIFLMALLGTYVVMRLVAGSLEERFTNNLIDAGSAVNDAMVTLEQENLDSLRAIIFTSGVAEAIQRRDATSLQTAILPLQANFDIDFVDVVDAEGRPIISLRSRNLRQDQRDLTTDVGRFEITQRVLQGMTDQRGDKWSQIVTASAGNLMFYTSGPAKVGDRPVGAVLVGMSGERMIAELARSSLANVSLYGPRGEVLATTLTAVTGDLGQPIDPSLYQRLMESDTKVVERSLHIGRRGYQEMLGRLEIRGVPAAVLGISLSSGFIANAGNDTRNQMILLFAVVILFVLVIGFALARALTEPILKLVAASRQIAGGNLDTYVKPTSADETGVLTDSFNEMVAGLRDRERIKDTMGKYMTPQVAEAILNGEVKLGGERKEVTILMSDIRGFTTMSERLPPEQLVTLLNGYFERMIQAILEFDGTIDKFIGDAILVVYGAPKFFPNHAEQAVRTCLRMRQYLVEYNDEITQRGFVPIRIGIGVNTGHVVAGDIGSSVRKEYTVMGDTVNITQRVEDLCKEFRTDVLISDSTYQQVKDLVIVGEEYEVTVRGRTEQTKIFTIVGMRDDPAGLAGAGRTRAGSG